MNVKDLVAKYNATEVAGRLLVRVDGRNEWMANYDDNGFQLTEVGKALEAGTLRSEGQLDDAPAPKARTVRAKKTKDDVSEDDLGAGVPDEVSE